MALPATVAPRGLASPQSPRLIYTLRRLLGIAFAKSRDQLQGFKDFTAWAECNAPLSYFLKSILKRPSRKYLIGFHLSPDKNPKLPSIFLSQNPPLPNTCSLCCLLQSFLNIKGELTNSRDELAAPRSAGAWWAPPHPVVLYPSSPCSLRACIQGSHSPSLWAPLFSLWAPLCSSLGISRAAGPAGQVAMKQARVMPEWAYLPVGETGDLQVN